MEHRWASFDKLLSQWSYFQDLIQVGRAATQHDYVKYSK